MTENKRIFFIKKGGLITGPFTVTKLKLMIDEGSLTGKDLFSTEKNAWLPVSGLFPETFPETAPAVPDPADEGNADVPPPLFPPELPPVSDRESAPASAAVLSSAEVLSSTEEAEAGPVPRWLRDTAALIVLPWEFEAEAPLLRTKKRKLIASALILNLLPCSLLLALSCRQYAFRLSWPLAPLFAAGVLLSVGLVSAAAARIAAVFRLPSGSSPPEEWKLFGIALFMTYGTLSGTLMTFYPCFRTPAHSFAGALLSGASVLPAVSAATLLAGNFLERFRAVPAKWAFLFAPLLTSGMVGMICFLIDLIRN